VEESFVFVMAGAGLFSSIAGGRVVICKQASSMLVSCVLLRYECGVCVACFMIPNEHIIIYFRQIIEYK